MGRTSEWDNPKISTEREWVEENKILKAKLGRVQGWLNEQYEANPELCNWNDLQAILDK